MGLVFFEEEVRKEIIRVNTKKIVPIINRGSQMLFKATQSESALRPRGIKNVQKYLKMTKG